MRNIFLLKYNIWNDFYGFQCFLGVEFLNPNVAGDMAQLLRKN